MNKLSDREKENNDFVDSICTQENFEKKKLEKVEKLYDLYEGELEDYLFVKDKVAYDKIILGGYIRYINYNDELKWGGILLKKVINKDKNIMVLANTLNKTYNVSFENNYVFYKFHTTQSDKLKKIFLSYLD